MQQIEVIFLDPVYSIIYSIRLHRYYKFCLSHYCYLISTDIAWPVVLSCWCDTHQQSGQLPGQGISVSAVAWQHFPTARIWDQSNCFPLPVLACSLCHGHRSLAVHFLLASSTLASPSPSLLPGRRNRAVRRHWQPAPASLPAPASSAGQRLRAQPSLLPGRRKSMRKICNILI